jgi:flagellar basal-body rod protein FlgB
MFQNLDVFRQSFAMAQNAAQKQAVVATNMANADTPGYVAQDVAPFEITGNRQGLAAAMRHTRSGHLLSGQSHQTIELRRDRLENSPNGNSVSLEEEMLKSVDAKRAHDRALTLYKTSLSILRTTLGRR